MTVAGVQKSTPESDKAARKQLLRRFWRAAAGFWRKGGDRRAWILSGAILAIVLIQLFLQYRMNLWNRSLFDALEQKNGAEVFVQTLIYVPLLVASVIFAVVNIYCRMTMQRLWREWMTNYV